MNTTRTLALSLLSLLPTGCAPDAGGGGDREGDAVEGEGDGEGVDGEGEGEDGDGEGEGEGEGEGGEGEGGVGDGDNQATLADGTQYILSRVTRLVVVDGRVAYEAVDDSGYWSVLLDVPDGPGSFDCADGGFAWVFSDFFLPFSSTHVESTCGVDVVEAPYTHGGSFVGTYQGTLINDDQGRQERVLSGTFAGVVTAE